MYRKLYNNITTINIMHFPKANSYLFFLNYSVNITIAIVRMINNNINEYFT
jgi:hypothetical protein